MSDDHIIGVNSPAEHIELERRQRQRRREDQVRTIEQAADVLARERRYQLLQAASRIYHATYSDANNHDFEKHIEDCVIDAEALLAEIERREKETEQQRKESQ